MKPYKIDPELTMYRKYLEVLSDSELVDEYNSIYYSTSTDDIFNININFYNTVDDNRTRLIEELMLLKSIRIGKL